MHCHLSGLFHIPLTTYLTRAYVNCTNKPHGKQITRSRIAINGQYNMQQQNSIIMHEILSNIMILNYTICNIKHNKTALSNDQEPIKKGVGNIHTICE